MLINFQFLLLLLLFLFPANISYFYSMLDATFNFIKHLLECSGGGMRGYQSFASSMACIFNLLFLCVVRSSLSPNLTFNHLVQL